MEGLVPLDELVSVPVETPEQVVQVGDHVKVTIISSSPARRLALIPYRLDGIWTGNSTLRDRYEHADLTREVRTEGRPPIAPASYDAQRCAACPRSMAGGMIRLPPQPSTVRTPVEMIIPDSERPAGGRLSETAVHGDVRQIPAGSATSLPMVR
ncbi:hypothetical protein ABZ907_05570 [Nonomuraea wenchangensis]